ncbi:hypothetical protein HN011_010429 [Eciton burchellii]|nr:hypothetical protein HN011_010429 [Eciton burchellii]
MTMAIRIIRSGRRIALRTMITVVLRETGRMSEAAGKSEGFVLRRPRFGKSEPLAEEIVKVIQGVPKSVWMFF